MTSEILVLQGPNLNMLGLREPDKYGTSTLAEIHKNIEDLFWVKQGGSPIELSFFQSNSEAELIDRLHQGISKTSGLIINPAGLTHTSVSLRDAVVLLTCPKVEVHLSNIYKREEFRRHSFFHDVVDCVITGAGSDGYLMALEYLLKKQFNGDGL